MKPRVIYGIMILFIITLTITMFIKEKKDLVIITNDTIYSIYHSDNNEKIAFELLTNQPDNYYFDDTYISSVVIKNNTEEISLELFDIIKGEDEIHYENDEFYHVSITTKMKLVSNDMLISMENVFLEINYENGETVSISIGEFNYLFYEEVNYDISLNNLSANYQEIDDVNTIGGINLHLANVSGSNINITNIQIVSSLVSFNLENILEREECPQTYSTADCLTINEYNFNQNIDIDEIDILLRKDNTIELYLPLLYQEEASFIHRFAFIVTYEINGVEKVFLLDDFPYMRTSIFNDSVKDDFNVYKLPN